MIDEKQLLKEIEEEASKDKLGLSRYIPIRAMKEMVEIQPKVSGWISCNERLPEDGVDVLVWFEYFRYGEYNRLFQTTGISFTYNGKWSGFVNGQSGWSQLSILAWQSLPAPYDGRF